MPNELTEEDVFANDIDPIDAIREIRKAEGASEESLAELKSTSDELGLDNKIESDTPAPGDDELDAFDNNTQDTGEEELSPDPADEPKGDLTETGKTDGEVDQEVVKPNGDGEPKGDADEDTATPKLRTFKANGQDFSFTEEEVMEQFETVFGQAMNYTQKMQKMAPFRKMISALEDQGITSDQLNVAIDALKGDKGALQKLIEDNKIDAYDLTKPEEIDEYTPNVYGKDDIQLDLEETTSMIKGDPEFATTVDVVDNRWDSKSRQTFASNPQMIVGLHNDIKSGVYEQVAPLAAKMKVLDGNTKSDVEYYMLAGERVRTQQESSAKPEKTAEELNKVTQDAEKTFEEASSTADRKRAATTTRGRSDRKGVIDYLDDDDEKFDSWYDNLMSSN